MRQLTIHRLYFTQADCYKTSKKGKPAGIQVHSTGANNPYLHRYVGPDDGLLGPNKYGNTHNRPGGNVCANAYIGLLADGQTVTVYQALPWEQHCWLSGSGDSGKKSANAQGFIGFEVCEDARNNRAYFQRAVWETSVSLCAYLCWKYNIYIGNVRDHAELHRMGMATDHDDITRWLRPWGLNMDAYRNEVQKAMREGVTVTYIEGDKTWTDGPEGETTPEEPAKEDSMIKKAIVKGDGYLNLRSAPDKSAESIAKLYPGEIVTVTAQYPGGWSFVTAKGKQGYCVTEFLADAPAQANPAPPTEPAKDEAEPVQDEDAAAIIAEIIATTEHLRELEDQLALLITGAVG